MAANLSTDVQKETKMPSARDEIVGKTCELLELQGYHATGLNQIIKESGSPKGSLYYYFPGGKEELATEAVRQAGKIVLERIRANLANITDPVESIRGFIMNVALNVERSGFRAGGPITTIAMETASSSGPLREECHRIYSDWQLAFASKLVQGGMGEERAQRLAVLIIAALEGGIILCRTSRSREPLESVAEEIALLLQASVSR
jgi:TetR/AcrR family transcriptional repressor of lmrAB and yxaGH operons